MQTIIAQKAMPNIKGHSGVLSAEAWLGYGFHENRFTSGLGAAVERIDGVQLPFEIAGADREPRVASLVPLFGFLKVTGIRAVVDTALTLVLDRSLSSLSYSRVKSSVIYNSNLESIYLYMMFKPLMLH